MLLAPSCCLPHHLQAEYVDQQKLRAAALKIKLSKLAQERRRLDQEQGAALAAKQAELAQLRGGS